MATHELYERRYEGDVRVDLRLNRDRFTAEFFGENPSAGRYLYPPARWPAVDSAKAWTDAQATRASASDWRRVLECPVCRTRDVRIERVPEHDAFSVDCPVCRIFVATGPAFSVLGDAYFGDAEFRPSLMALSDFLRLRGDDERAEWLLRLVSNQHPRLNVDARVVTCWFFVSPRS